MATSVYRPRPDTPERWQRALDRAVAAGLEVFTVADTGERMVTSASKLDTLHRSDGLTCTCEAALAGDPVCCHRAVVRRVLGWFGRTPPLVACFGCRGEGWVYVEAGGDAWPYKIGCAPCRGTGRVLAPTPRLEPVAPVALAAD